MKQDEQYEKRDISKQRKINMVIGAGASLLLLLIFLTVVYQVQRYRCEIYTKESIDELKKQGRQQFKESYLDPARINDEVIKYYEIAFNNINLDRIEPVGFSMAIRLGQIEYSMGYLIPTNKGLLRYDVSLVGGIPTFKIKSSNIDLIPKFDSKIQPAGQP